MKKSILLAIFLIIMILPGCVFNKPEYIKNATKPNNSFYTKEVYSKLKHNEEFTLELFNPNLYKYYAIDKEDSDILLSFIESLTAENYLSSEDNAEDETDADETSNNSLKDLLPKYKLSITFDNSKFIINVYSKELVTLYPWDGVYEEDIISLKNVSDHANIYEFCHYIENKQQGAR